MHIKNSLNLVCILVFRSNSSIFASRGLFEIQCERNFRAMISLQKAVFSRCVFASARLLLMTMTVRCGRCTTPAQRASAAPSSCSLQSVGQLRCSSSRCWLWQDGATESSRWAQRCKHTAASACHIFCFYCFRLNRAAANAYFNSGFVCLSLFILLLL